MHKGNGDKASEGFIMYPNDTVMVTEMNHIVEVQHQEHWNRQCNIKKLDKDTYMEISTGQIKEFEHSENRKENLNSLRQTFKKLRYLINNNFTGKGNELHVILTYRKNMKDPKQLYEDFDRFMKRLRYEFKDKSTLDYINVVEPQERGAWHCHVLVRFNELDKVFIKNKDMRELWGNGFVTVKGLENVDNIGAYLSAYLADIELSEGNVGLVVGNGLEVVTKQVEGSEKKFIKGGRLHMYPPGMNLFRKSKGIVEPKRVGMKYKDIKKVVGSAQPHYQKSYTFVDEEKDFSNTITYLQYNKKRKN